MNRGAWEGAASGGGGSRVGETSVHTGTLSKVMPPDHDVGRTRQPRADHGNACNCPLVTADLEMDHFHGTGVSTALLK